MESKSHAQDLADRMAFFLTIIALVAGSLTFVIWLSMTHTLSFALERLVSVIVIACPHALGLAIPLVIAMVTTLAAQDGILVRNRRAFEDARTIDIVVFDKTGTLTYGSFEITDFFSLGSFKNEEILAIVAASEKFAKHPIATAALAKAREQGLSIPHALEGKTIPGKGTEFRIGTKKFFAGNQRLIESITFTAADAPQMYERALEKAEELMKQGKTTIFVATEERIEGVLAASDVIREASYKACERLKNLGIRTAMITGDNNYSAQFVANKLGIEMVLAEVLPHQKALEIKKLKEQKLKVAMVGDGINDAPALAASDIGIAIGAGADIAIEAADIILVKNDPEKVVDVIALSRLTRRKMIQNLLWATGYNIIALPIAAGALYSYDIMISPAVAALCMSLSTVIVAINSRLISYESPLNS